MKYLAILFGTFFLGLGLLAQPAQLSITTSGTGRTTGHIADLSITNKGNQPATIAPGIFYIPATHRFQSYVGRVADDITIQPGQTAAVPINGYCTDVHSPPVPSGEPMRDFHDWILVTDEPAIPVTSEPTVPEPMNPPGSGGSTSTETILRPDRVLQPFTPADIPLIVRSPGYRRFTEALDRTSEDLTITYPGTDIPVAGTLAVARDPERLAPLIVEMVVRVEDAATVIQTDPTISTPFSGAPAREREALVQQTIWLTTAALTGDEYRKEDFATNTHRQFAEASGRSVASLPEEERERLDSGVDDFWDAFSAVGVEAKVLRTDGQPIGIQYQNQAPPTKCECEKIEFDVAIYRNDILRDSKSGIEGDNININTVKLAVGELDNSQEYEVRISNIEVFCTCEDSPAEANRCDVYPPVDSSDPKHEDSTNSDRTRDGTTHDQVGIYITNDSGKGVKHNAHATQSDAAWTDDTRTTFKFILTTDEKGKIPEVSQRFVINSRCESEDCGGDQRVRVCDRTVRVVLKEDTD